MRKTGLIRGIWLALACTASMTVCAQDEPAVIVDVPAGDLATAVETLRRQTGGEILFRADQLRGVRTEGVRGELDSNEALDTLLEGTGFSAERDSSGAVFIVPAPVRVPQPVEPGPSSRSGDEAGDEEVVSLSAIAVTGTRIRGGETPSPVITIGFENIREEGFSDLGDVIRSLPQNFSGGQNPGVPSLGYSGAGLQNQNITGGSALNLRGLGPDATLTLLNGRRMAHGGMAQAVDINAIPVEAIDRIEIVADGASAIYGSDAVGGVGNVILRRDFEGLAVSSMIGTAMDGGMTTREYGATTGAAWNSGGLLATVKSARTDPIYVDERYYTRHMTHPATLYPASDLVSGLVSGNQSLGKQAEVRIDLLRTERDQVYNLFSPDGRINRVNSETATTLVSPSVELFLPNDWSVTLSGTRAKSEHLQYQHWEIVDTGETTQSVHDCLCNEASVYEVSAEGPLFMLAGGDARLAAGTGYRSNDYVHFNYLAHAATTQGSEGSRFAYAELNLPLLGGLQDDSIAPRLALTAAVRTEDYDSFGRVSVPKLGVIYAPGNNVTLKLSWGKSFKAPTLHQRFFAPYAMLTAPDYFGGSDYPEGSTVLAVGGGNTNLDAERATTWAASFMFHPEAIPGLDLEATWYDIDYTGRALEPITNFAEALSNPVYRQFVLTAPNEDVQEERLSEAGTFYNFAGVPYDSGAVAALVDLRYMNVARQKIRGIDLSGRYRIDIGQGNMVLRGAWSESPRLL